MRKIPLAIVLNMCSSISLAYTPITTIVDGWKSLPIVVNDSNDYFYAQEVCLPQLIILPKTTCGIKETVIIQTENDLTPP